MTTTEPLRPILVMMSWRGGARLTRCLESIAASNHHFKRIVLSITATENSDDMRQARAFQAEHPGVEVICTQRELPTMQHQAFWVTYLEQTGATKDDWIYWLAYDDQVRKTGIDEIVDGVGNWPLERGTCYFGPWAMRHEKADELFSGPWDTPLESWTSFPLKGPTKMPVLQWIGEQLQQPTYMQMSGSVCPLENFIQLRDGKPTKQGPMRIEMAVAASHATSHVQEFREPVSIIYGRPNSDRAGYGKLARREDLHLMMWLIRYTGRHPAAAPALARLLGASTAQHVKLRMGRRPQREEEWRLRGTCVP